MIVREILQRPELADKFDFYNDYRDTLIWLAHLRESDGVPLSAKHEAIDRLMRRAIEARERGERFIA